MMAVGAMAFGQTITAPAGQKVVLTAEGKGNQIYKCTQTGEMVKWTLVAPEAQLFVGDDLVGTHGAGPSWTVQGGTVHGRMLKSESAPDAGAVPWLLLQATGAEGKGPMTTVTYIVRNATKGGAAKEEGCDVGHVGEVSRMPYSATYTFYAAAN